MGFYREKVLPILIEHGMRGELFSEERRVVLADARGTVLEIGFGTGLNLPHYSDAVTEILALDPVEPPRKYIENHLRHRHSREQDLTRTPTQVLGHERSFRFIRGSAEAIPLPDQSVDCVVSTWTFCSIENPHRALCEIHRVLKVGGSFLFLEHGLSPDHWVARAQHALTPLQKRVAGGCHLDRKIDELIQNSPLSLVKLETFYLRGPKLLTYHYRGRAIKN